MSILARLANEAYQTWLTGHAPGASIFDDPSPELLALITEQEAGQRSRKLEEIGEKAKVSQ